MKMLLLALGISCAFFGTAFAKSGDIPSQAFTYGPNDEESDSNYNETILLAAMNQTSSDEMGQEKKCPKCGKKMSQCTCPKKDKMNNGQSMNKGHLLA